MKRERVITCSSLHAGYARNMTGFLRLTGNILNTRGTYDVSSLKKTIQFVVHKIVLINFTLCTEF